MRISKKEFHKKLDQINLLDYKIDYKREQNFFFYKGYKYVLEIIVSENYKVVENYYKFKL
tara:strand:+ start:372 stop:551 length:180 start_codon:yes stop_codon:yes gene_type:complete